MGPGPHQGALHARRNEGWLSESHPSRVLSIDRPPPDQGYGVVVGGATVGGATVTSDVGVLVGGAVVGVLVGGAVVGVGVGNVASPVGVAVGGGTVTSPVGVGVAVTTI